MRLDEQPFLKKGLVFDDEFSQRNCLLGCSKCLPDAQSLDLV
jgi:hypothetical protein